MINFSESYRFLIYFAITLLCKSVVLKKNIINKKNIKNTSIVIQNINKIYSEIKKNEIAPKTDYLFHGTKKDKIKKSMEQMNKLNQMIGYDSE